MNLCNLWESMRQLWLFSSALLIVLAGLLCAAGCSGLDSAPYTTTTPTQAPVMQETPLPVTTAGENMPVQATPVMYGAYLPLLEPEWSAVGDVVYSSVDEDGVSLYAADQTYRKTGGSATALVRIEQNTGLKGGLRSEWLAMEEGGPVEQEKFKRWQGGASGFPAWVEQDIAGVTNTEIIRTGETTFVKVKVQGGTLQDFADITKKIDLAGVSLL